MSGEHADGQNRDPEGGAPGGRRPGLNSRQQDADRAERVRTAADLTWLYVSGAATLIGVIAVVAAFAVRRRRN